MTPKGAIIASLLSELIFSSCLGTLTWLSVSSAFQSLRGRPSLGSVPEPTIVAIRATAIAAATMNTTVANKPRGLSVCVVVGVLVSIHLLSPRKSGCVMSLLGVSAKGACEGVSMPTLQARPAPRCGAHQ